MAENETGSQEWQALRSKMVAEQLRKRGLRDERILGVMASVPRERFVPASVRHAAYDDRAIPIGHAQTISQPFIVAYMTEKLALRPRSVVLEVGTGSGYQTAVLAALARHVYTIERISALRQEAEDALSDLGISNVTMSSGDGSLGLREHAPFDRIMVTAGAPNVPAPLVDQLTPEGVLVVPVGGRKEQTIIRIERRDARTIKTSWIPCRFVKLIGQEAWNDPGTTPAATDPKVP